VTRSGCAGPAAATPCTCRPTRSTPAGSTCTWPLHEPSHELLITALLGAGRRADALTHFRHVRYLLATELGTEPGPELLRLNQLTPGGPEDRQVEYPTSTAGSVTPGAQDRVARRSTTYWGDPTMIEVRVLGPVEVRRDGEPVAVRGNQPLAVLAMLAAARGRPVAADRIVDDVRAARELTAEEPLRGEPWRLLALALWPANRSADALAVLARHRRLYACHRDTGDHAAAAQTRREALRLLETARHPDLPRLAGLLGVPLTEVTALSGRALAGRGREPG